MSVRLVAMEILMQQGKIACLLGKMFFFRLISMDCLFSVAKIIIRCQIDVVIRRYLGIQTGQTPRSEAKFL
jgi:hypothetical protein